MKIIKYLYYDNASTNNNVNTYNNASQVHINGNASVNITYDSTNTRYIATTSSQGETGITLLNNTSDIIIGRVKFQLDSTSGNRQIGLFARCNNTNYFFKLLVAGSVKRVETSVSGSDSSISSYFSVDTDYIIELERNTTSLTGRIYNAETNTLIKTLTLTASELTSNSSVDYGLLFGYNDNTVIYFDEVTFMTP